MTSRSARVPSWRPRADALAILLALVLGIPWEGRAHAGWFTEVADTNTAIPGGTGNFADFGSASLSGGVLVFSADGSPDQAGIYTRTPDGSLAKVIDTNTPIPGGTANFNSLGGVSFDGHNVVFNGGLVSGPRDTPVDVGLFETTLGGSVTRLVDYHTPIPNGSGNFTNLGAPSISGGQVAFEGSGTGGQDGIYVAGAGGTIAKIADTNTTMPGYGGKFIAFDSETPIVNGVVAFRGFGVDYNPQGIYTASVGGPLTTVADTNTAIPGGSGKFLAFGGVNLSSDGQVAFTGLGSGTGPSGLYLATPGGGIVRIVDGQTSIPGGSGYFGSIYDFSVDRGEVIFDTSLEVPNVSAIYSYINGILSEVIGPGDMLDGKLVTEAILRGNLSQGEFAFTATFSDGSEGLFLANLQTVPEPRSLLLLVLGTVTATGLVAASRRTCPAALDLMGRLRLPQRMASERAMM